MKILKSNLTSDCSCGIIYLLPSTETNQVQKNCKEIVG